MSTVTPGRLGRTGRTGRTAVATLLAVLGSLLAVTAASAAPPTITAISVTPQFLTVDGGEVTIAADVDDDGTLTEVHAVVTGPAGPQDVAMTATTGSGYEGTFTVPANTEPMVIGYAVEVVAVDDAAEETRVSGPTIIVDPYAGPETEPPVITGFIAAPTTVPVGGGTVTGSVTVTSSAGVAGVGFVVYLASGPQVFATMTRVGTSDVWQGDVSIPANSTDDPVSHTVEVFAEGDDGGSAQEIAGNIEQEGQPVFDQAPVVDVTSVSPTVLPSEGGEVDITATASDDGFVDSVVATVTGPAGPVTVDLVPVGGVSYGGSITLPANPSRTAAETYTVEVTATDDAALTSSDTGPSVLVEAVPNAEPVVSQASVTPADLPSTGGQVTIRATATDPDGTVATVSASVTAPDSQVTDVPLARVGTSEVFEASYAVPANTSETPAEHAVGITAVDDEGGVGSAEAGSATVAGVVPFDEAPDVFDSSVSPTSLPAAGGVVTIAASATDDRAILEVYATVTFPGGSTRRVDLDGTAGPSRYQGQITLPDNRRFVPASYAVEVTAVDDIGQPGSEQAGTVVSAARADAAPTVRDATISPSVLTGSGQATISARVFDDRSLAAAYAVLQAPGLAPVQVDLVRVASGALRRGVFTAPANTTTAPIAYAVTVVGRDGAGQTTQVQAGTLTVDPVPLAPSVVEVDRQRLRFGRVATDRRERRVVEVTHVGPAAAGRLTLDLRVAGAAFRLGGRYADRDTLRLRPGQTKRLVVVFEPGRRGKRTGELRLRRTDGRQAGLGVALVGRGIR